MVLPSLFLLSHSSSSLLLLPFIITIGITISHGYPDSITVPIPQQSSEVCSTLSFLFCGLLLLYRTSQTNLIEELPCIFLNNFLFISRVFFYRLFFFYFFRFSCYCLFYFTFYLKCWYSLKKENEGKREQKIVFNYWLGRGKNWFLKESKTAILPYYSILSSNRRSWNLER